jgi:diguanylate cyclase (GGDEF)-like protein
MIQEERYKILETGVHAAEIITASSYSGIKYGNFCIYLYRQLRSYLDQLRLYIFDESLQVLKEEIVCNETGPVQGQDLMPLYLLPQGVYKHGKAIQIHRENTYMLLIPLLTGDQFFGLLILDSSKSWTNSMQYFETLGKSVAMGLHQLDTLHTNRHLLSFFNNTVDIANSFHLANSIEQLVKNFARQAVTPLNFDRVTVYINSRTTQSKSFIFCVTSWGTETEIKKIRNLPEHISEPLPINQNTGYWFPLITNKRKVGLVLFDNLYSHYTIPDSYLYMLAPLCNQFAATVDNIHLFQNIQRAARRDKLTELYNRAYFELQMNQIDREENYPLSFIIGDVNGLKITNDIFGHFEGDVILKEIAAQLKKVCRKDDIIARWGGDEFVILLPKTSEKRAEAIIQATKQRCKEVRNTKIQLSISMGCATKKNGKTELDAIMKKAEERMYRDKLLERTFFRNTFIATMREMLHRNCQEPKDHIDRMNNLSTMLGKALDLSDNDMEELKLLAMLHDIGKVAISSEILNKPGRLNKEEWAEVRKHSEAGYRIAQASPELSRISSFILFHHERWDGEGYPMGKKGKEIPLLSRIIAVIDAYDVMTHERVYKKAMTHEEAVNELITCSGTQFDPEIVDTFLQLQQSML